MKYVKNEEAVSPVIGVILMVVITVIIAAVLAVFAFGVGAPTQTPTVSVKITSMDKVNNATWIQHYGGDSVRLQDIKITAESLDNNAAIIDTIVYDLKIATGNQFTSGDTLKLITTNNTGRVYLNGGTTPLGTSTGGLNMTAANADSIRVTIIHVPTGNVLSKPAAKIT